MGRVMGEVHELPVEGIHGLMHRHQVTVQERLTQTSIAVVQESWSRFPRFLGMNFVLDLQVLLARQNLKQSFDVATLLKGMALVSVGSLWWLLEADRFDAIAMHQPEPSLAPKHPTPPLVAAIDDETEAPALPENHGQDPRAPGRDDDTNTNGRQEKLGHQWRHMVHLLLVECNDLDGAIETLLPSEADQNGKTSNDLDDGVVCLVSSGVQIGQFVQDPNREKGQEGNSCGQFQLQQHLFLWSILEDMRCQIPFATEIQTPSEGLVTSSH
mmetsp:Transcript_58548/g.92759  ORF Transcript_58548/g.92759 Transcript_58548/m.92759 type:complete len:270 (-) Transcript_58548:225-1034(-)